MSVATSIVLGRLATPSSLGLSTEAHGRHRLDPISHFYVPGALPGVNRREATSLGVARKLFSCALLLSCALCGSRCCPGRPLWARPGAPPLAVRRGSQLDVVPPHLAEYILDEVQRQEFAGAAAVAEAEGRVAGGVADRVGPCRRPRRRRRQTRCWSAPPGGRRGRRTVPGGKGQRASPTSFDLASSLSGARRRHLVAVRIELVRVGPVPGISARRQVGGDDQASPREAADRAAIARRSKGSPRWGRSCGTAPSRTVERGEGAAVGLVGTVRHRLLEPRPAPGSP